MAIPNPNPNIEDGKKCDNKTYSSNKIEALVAAATELPTPESGDAGKVLTVNSDSDGYELDNVGGIPSIAAGDAGKVITVNAGETAYELEAPLAIDDSAASATSVYSSYKVDTLLSGKADNIELHTTLTHTTSGTVFNFDRAGDFIQISVNEDSQVQLPTAWASIGSLTTDYYTSGTGFTIIPFALVGGHQIDVRINKTNGTVEIQADTASNLWAQGLCVYHI